MNKGEEGGWKKALFISLLIFAICFVYAFIRYNIVRNVSLEHLPLYITNKAVALSATIMIGLSFLLGPLAHFFPQTFVKHLDFRGKFGLVGFGAAAFHALMSLILFDKANYPKFFLENGKLNFIGETSIIFGILAFLIFSIVSVISIPSIEEKLDEEKWQQIQRFGYIAYIFVLLHVVMMGYKGWFTPESWQYGLASITLVASIFIVFVLLMRLIVIVFPAKSK